VVVFNLAMLMDPPAKFGKEARMREGAAVGRGLTRLVADPAASHSATSTGTFCFQRDTKDLKGYCSTLPITWGVLPTFTSLASTHPVPEDFLSVLRKESKRTLSALQGTLPGHGRLHRHGFNGCLEKRFQKEDQEGPG